MPTSSQTGTAWRPTRGSDGSGVGVMDVSGVISLKSWQRWGPARPVASQVLQAHSSPAAAQPEPSSGLQRWAHPLSSSLNIPPMPGPPASAQSRNPPAAQILPANAAHPPTARPQSSASRTGIETAPSLSSFPQSVAHTNESDAIECPDAALPHPPGPDQSAANPAAPENRTENLPPPSGACPNPAQYRAPAARPKAALSPLQH